MANKEKNFTSAVIYVHNAQNYIEDFLRMIIDVMETNFEHSEIICVNDASDDNSYEIVKKISSVARATSVSIINMSYFHGLELAMNAGVDLSIGDFVFEFDHVDLECDRNVIMDIYYHALKGYDIVSASPTQKEKFTSKLFYGVFDKFTNMYGRMGTESFRVLSRRVINRISSMNKSVPYRKAVYSNCGLKTDNIKYEAKKSNHLISDRKEKNYRLGLAMDSLILFTDVGYRFSMLMTVVMMFVSIFMVVYSVVVYLTSHPVAGWTTTILFLSIALFGLFGVLTIIIKYLQLLVDLVFRRKHYNFESIEKLTK